jgi:hypothetical protein
MTRRSAGIVRTTLGRFVILTLIVHRIALELAPDLANYC